MYPRLRFRLGTAGLLLASFFSVAVNPARSLGSKSERSGAMTAAQLQLQKITAKHQDRLEAWGNPRIDLGIDASLGHREGFSVRKGADNTIHITGGGVGGLKYGIQEWAGLLETSRSIPERIDIVEQPDFELRGNVLFLMKDSSYDYELTPEEFPWFFDRAIMSRHLDYLYANRFNTLFLWTGHLFPSIVEMPEYPDATDLSRADLLRNQAQFKWLTDECSKRNINVLLHFYNIHIPKALASSRGIPVHYREPNAFVTQYVRYALDRFLAEFKDVGLYVCPGEKLRPKYQPDWIRDVIFAAAKASGHHPPVVVRTWTLDKTRLQEVCRDAYDNTYTEHKHNIEMIVSPVPDPEHRDWLGVAKKHIVNLHELGDIKPFRWCSPLFIHEMVGEWQKLGLDGAEVYNMVSWRWPYTLDKLETHQDTYWPSGKKLLTLERDWIWLEAMGRYLWKVDRDPEQEREHWDSRLAERFGNLDAARLVRQWYDATGPILPGLQNLTCVPNMNWHPTAVCKSMLVRLILNGRASERTLSRFQGGHPSLPVDTYFFERYKKRFNQPELANRISMSVLDYAEKLASNEDVTSKMTPDKITRLFVEMAEESLELARKAAARADIGREELARFVTDSQALINVARTSRCKIMAAINKRAYLLSRRAEFLDALIQNMEESVTVFEKLVELTDRTYITATDLHMERMNVNWHKAIDLLRQDRDEHNRASLLQAAEMLERVAALKTTPGFYWIEAAAMEGRWNRRYDRPGTFGDGFRVCTRSGRAGGVLRKQVRIKEAARYAVWTHGLIGPGQAHGEFLVKVGGQLFRPTHKEAGPEDGQFIWHRAGRIDLMAGPVEIVVKGAGSGVESVDVIVLSKDLKWKPTVGHLGAEGATAGP